MLGRVRDWLGTMAERRFPFSHLLSGVISDVSNCQALFLYCKRCPIDETERERKIEFRLRLFSSDSTEKREPKRTKEKGDRASRVSVTIEFNGRLMNHSETLSSLLRHFKASRALSPPLVVGSIMRNQLCLLRKNSRVSCAADVSRAHTWRPCAR